MDNELQNDLNRKLNYLGLDLNNIPKFLYDFSPLEFNVSRLNNDKDHKVFRYVPIDKIDILLTPCLREDPVREKYSKAMPLVSYLVNDESSEALERYSTFLNMLRELQLSDVENVDNIQKELKQETPFKVRYDREHLWHIYYAEETNRYFMMVCTKESNFAEFFYLLKKKIECENNPKEEVPKIFVPINYVNYSEKYLDHDELIDVENYLWLFTKDWPTIYEVHNKNDKMSIEIVGQTYVYDSIKSTYRVKLNTKNEAERFYKTIKALFMLQTGIVDHYSFEPEINNKNELELYFDGEKIDYNDLTLFLKSEYEKAIDYINNKNDECKKLEKDLEKICEKVSKQELLYIQKQKKIGIYIECRKTFSGRMKYFFNPKKIEKQIKKEMEEENIDVEQPKNEENSIALDPYNEAKKDVYTIEDLIVIYSIYEKTNKRFQNLTQDIKAMNLKLENVKRKVKNADTYIKEIDKHRKSFFDFWKFTKKDEVLSLEEGEVESKPSKSSVQKYFDIESDFENLGVQMDKLQRVKLSKEETDSCFVAKNNIVCDVLNEIKKGEDEDDKRVKACFQSLKDEFKKNCNEVDIDNIDIFGNMLDDNRKTKYIGSRSHRENEKNEYSILNINKKIDVYDFEEQLQSILKYIEGAIPKITSSYDLKLYKLVSKNNKINENAIWTMNIDPEDEFQNYNDKGEKELNLIKINFKEGMPLLFYTNIMLYDNQNKTLPEGMDLSKQVLIDTSRFNFELTNETKFRTNDYFKESFDLIKPKNKNINVYEYNITLKQ